MHEHDLHLWSTLHAVTARLQGSLSAVQWCSHAGKSTNTILR